MPFSFSQLIGFAILIYAAAYIHWYATDFTEKEQKMADNTIPQILID